MQRPAQLAILLAAGTVPAALAALAVLQRSPDVVACLAVAGIVGLAGYRWTVYLVPRMAHRHEKAGLFGKDINKKGTAAGNKRVPEALGLAPGAVCIVCLASIHALHTLRAVPRLCDALGIAHHPSKEGAAAAAEDPWTDDFPAALASIAFMLMLGFVDDVLDLPWRVKLVMPLAASLPLIAAYSGSTAIGIPKPIISALQLPYTYLELGPLYYVYMVALVIFCTNSINILAGVNGLEAGQTFLVGGAILTHNVLTLARSEHGAHVVHLACNMFVRTVIVVCSPCVIAHIDRAGCRTVLWCMRRTPSCM